MLNFLRRKQKTLSSEEELQKWESEGRPAPPPHSVKQNAITAYRLRFNTAILVETGTYLGDMIEAQRDKFGTIYSIELSQQLFKRAVKRFKAYPHISILHGDSGKMLDTLVPLLPQQALFWLDGHFPGGITALGEKECPVINELKAIFRSKLDHIILIDDARLFNGTNDYPTVTEIKSIFADAGKKYDLEIRDDIIRLTPIS